MCTKSFQASCFFYFSSTSSSYGLKLSANFVRRHVINLWGIRNFPTNMLPSLFILLKYQIGFETFCILIENILKGLLMKFLKALFELLDIFKDTYKLYI